MSLMNVKALVLSVIFFLVLDALFIGAFMKDWQSLLLRVQGEKMEVRMLSALAVYVIMVLAWVYFVYRPFLVHKSVGEAVKTGAILGFCIYGVFELTNFAIIKKWDMKFVLIGFLKHSGIHNHYLQKNFIIYFAKYID